MPNSPKVSTQRRKQILDYLESEFNILKTSLHKPPANDEEVVRAALPESEVEVLRKYFAWYTIRHTATVERYMTEHYVAPPDLSPYLTAARTTAITAVLESDLSEVWINVQWARDVVEEYHA